MKYFPKYAEPIPGETTEALAKLAKECKVYLIGGTCNETLARYEMLLSNEVMIMRERERYRGREGEQRRERILYIGGN